MAPNGILTTAFVVLASAVTRAAAAQGYVEASIGQSDHKVDCSGLASCEPKDTGHKVLGGFMFMPDFGVGTGWVDLGKATGSDALDIDGMTVTGSGDAESRGVSLAGIGVLPLGDASMFGKLGVANLKTTLSVSATGARASDSTTSTGVFFGVGAGRECTKNLGGRIEWERFGIRYGDERDNVDVLSVGLVWRCRAEPLAVLPKDGRDDRGGHSVSTARHARSTVRCSVELI